MVGATQLQYRGLIVASKKKQLQQIVRRFVEATGKKTYSSREVARWAIDNKVWEATQDVLVRRCADEISQALREEYTTDQKGRKVRTKHVALVKDGAEQIAMWADMRTATRTHMRLAFQQRRRSIRGDCMQLKSDVDSYNEFYNPGENIQMSFNFETDLQEADLVRDLSSASEHEPRARQFDDVLRQSTS